MGINYDGGMIVGELGSKIEKPRDFSGELYEWIEEMGLDRMFMYYDADIEDNIVGFKVEDVLVSDMSGKWLTDVWEKAAEFYRLTGVPAKLIGTQNIR